MTDITRRNALHTAATMTVGAAVGTITASCATTGAGSPTIECGIDGLPNLSVKIV